ncbi:MULTISPECIES: aldo/keto reductase [Streptomyces]|nr:MULTISPECIES: aldo/keto reductase [Streptomyces]NEE23888.1 aldo/keto reductase [Streptomyces sp. SID7982]MDQ0293700.1 aryl-alcohol dehydrogenase-like predicted oxidoreductase [Streptomyces sp. DSM 41037]WPR52881.1 aldo/keto reductase [Streptomyces sp. S399]GFH63881.1 aldo/keto reductase [Streptomyces rutgersensis]GFH75045.1 aldo/keto reductase [Streptomyces diastaticus subsp. diastaticus]
MRTTELGDGGPAVGRIGLGAMGMSFAYDPRHRDDGTSITVIRRALDLGVNLIDTADVYGPFANEELVGRALLGRRHEAVLSSKGGVRFDGAEVTLDGRPEYLRSALEASLRRLRTDHLDLYFLHRVDPRVPVEESWGELADLVAEGKVRALGVSEASADEVRRAGAVHPVAAVQSEFSLFTRDFQDDVVPLCREHGIAFLCHSPLGSGLLSGRYRTRGDLTEGDDRADMPRFTEEAMAANAGLVDRVGAVGRRRGATSAQVALAWLLAQGEHVIPIPGTKTPRYLEQNVAAAELVLSAEDLDELDALPAPTGARE